MQALSCRIARLALLAAVGFVGAAGPANAEVTELRIGSGFGLHYLPFYVMEQLHLVEHQTQLAGLPPLKVSYLRLSGGAALNTALLSGAVDVVGAGVGPSAVFWDKTKGNLDVKAVAAMGDIPLVLLTSDARIRRIEDIQPGDKIALPAVRASMQATLLQMAAAAAKGKANYAALDQNTVSLAHGDASRALTTRSGIVNMHFSVAPYSTRELRDPGVHVVADTKSIVGGPMSLNLVIMGQRFHTANPAVDKAFLAALSEAMTIINEDRHRAAEIYIQSDNGSGVDAATIEAVLQDPELRFTTVPHGVSRMVSFMFDTGILKNRPAAWSDLFFPDAQAAGGD